MNLTESLHDLICRKTDFIGRTVEFGHNDLPKKTEVIRDIEMHENAILITFVRDSPYFLLPQEKITSITVERHTFQICAGSMSINAA